LLVPDPSLEEAGLRELWQELQIKVTLCQTLSPSTPLTAAPAPQSMGYRCWSCHCSAGRCTALVATLKYMTAGAAAAALEQ
jgi:hypothetical protein